MNWQSEEKEKNTYLWDLIWLQRIRNRWQKWQLNSFALFLLELIRWIAVSNCMSSKKKRYSFILAKHLIHLFFNTNLGIEPLVDLSAPLLPLDCIQSWICHIRCISSCSTSEIHLINMVSGCLLWLINTEKISKSLSQPYLCAIMRVILFNLSYHISDISPSAFLSNIWNDTPCREVSPFGGNIQNKFIKY